MSELMLDVRGASAGDAQDAFDQAFCDVAVRARGAHHGGVLPVAVMHTFLRAPVPFRTRFWLARDNGVVVGRIGANLSATRGDTGYVGFFEVVEAGSDAASVSRGQAVAQALLAAATAWLRDQGAKTLYGPLNFNTWFAYRFRTDADTAGFAWEPSNPPRYVDYFVRFGMRPIATYTSEAVREFASVGHATEGAHARARDQGYTFRMVDVATAMQRDLPLLYSLSMRGFADNFLFEPITLEQFRALYIPVAKSAQGVAYFVDDPEGTPVGFFFGFAHEGFFVFKSVAVLPAHQGRGLSNALIHLLAREATNMGFTKGIFALVKDGAISACYARKTETMWRHTYALFQA